MNDKGNNTPNQALAAQIMPGLIDCGGGTVWVEVDINPEGIDDRGGTDILESHGYGGASGDKIINHQVRVWWLGVRLVVWGGVVGLWVVGV